MISRLHKRGGNVSGILYLFLISNICEKATKISPKNVKMQSKHLQKMQGHFIKYYNFVTIEKYVKIYQGERNGNKRYIKYVLWINRR